MRTSVILFLFWLCQLPLAEAHIETVANLTLTHHDGKLYVKAQLDKRYLSLALMYEGDCDSQNMISRCAEEYFTTHVHFSIDENPLNLIYQGLALQRDYVILTFVIEDLQSIENLGVESDYMLKHNDNAITKYHIEIGSETHHFSTRKQLQKIKFNMKESE